MSSKFLKIHPADNVLVALSDLKAGEKISYNGSALALAEDIPAKHKFVERAMNPDEEILMYGVLVGKAMKPISAGASINTGNVIHKSAHFAGKSKVFKWNAPDV